MKNLISTLTATILFTATISATTLVAPMDTINNKTKTCIFETSVETTQLLDLTPKGSVVEFEEEFNSDEGLNFFQYSLRTPSKVTGSFAYIFDKNGLISVDYTHRNYSNTKLIVFRVCLPINASSLSKSIIISHFFEFHLYAYLIIITYISPSLLLMQIESICLY